MNRNQKIIMAVVAALAVIITAGGILWNCRPTRYYVTQYSDTTGLQAMFYIIESNKGDLIVIDGGNAGNADYVRSVIAKKGRHVDAWILTHPHPDHIGAFNMIWFEMQQDIDIIYATDIDYAIYYERAYEWDDIGGYKLFLDNMSETDKVQYLHTGDELEICGLQFKVLHACEDYVYEVSNDIGNDCGLMIRVTNQEETMLFCADVGIRMSDKIVGQYAEELKCDYLQMGHHGNGGLSESFYRIASPRIAFFDAPEWLMNPEQEGRYTTPENRDLMESLGAEVFYYATTPNRIELK